MLKKNTSVMAIIMICENNGKEKRKMYRVLSFVVYSLIENCVCIDYLPCQSKILCGISRNPTFKETSLNLLLGIGIPELLLDLVSCHGFMTESNSTVILNWRSRLINNYLSKGLFVIEQGSNQLNFIPNGVRLIINLVDQLKTDYVMVKSKEISAIENTIKQLHIHKNMHMTYKQYLYKTKDSEIDNLFLEYLVPVIKYLEHPALI